MNQIYGLPQPLTGKELVTITQEQEGNQAICSMPISMLATILSSPASWAASLPTTEPATSGVVSIS